MIKTYYPRLDETVFRTVLPDGMPVCVVKKEGFTRKSAYLVANYGSVHTSYQFGGESFRAPDGVAHYLEHKMFDLPGRDVSEEFAALGANSNAFTGYDMTAYYFTCTDHFDDCLRLLLEMVSTPYFTKESVDKERGIIAQEILMYADSADSRVFEMLAENMYRHHPIRVPISGSVESIQAITPEILYACHKAFYCPSNLMLCVEGDVDPEEVERIALEVLPKERTEPGVKDLGEPEDLSCPVALSRAQMDVAMPTFQLGFKCPDGYRGAEYARWEVLAELSAEALFGESSPLYLRLYEQGLIDSSFGGGLDTVDGCAMLSCGGDSYEPETVRDAVLEEARRLAETGIDDQAFERAKKSFLGRRIKDLDSFESTCYRLCAYAFDDYDYFCFPTAFEQVRAEQVREFLRDNVLQSRASLAIVEPRHGKEE